MARKGNGTSDDLVSSSITGPTNYTCHFWYQDPNAPSAAGTEQPWSISTSNQSYAIGFSWDHGNSAFQQAAFHRDSGGYKKAKLTSTLSANTWYAIGCMYDGTNVKAWLDGTNEANAGAGNPIGTSPSVSLLAGSVGTASFADGTIAEAACWDVALTTNEMLMLAAGACPLRVRPTSLIGYWPVDGVGSPEPDYSGNANHLTVTGTTVEDHPPVAPRFGFDVGIPYEVVAGGGGLSIPVAMADYRRRRAA